MPRSTRRKTHRDRGGAPRDLGGAIRGGPVHQTTPDRYYDSRLVRDPHAEPSMFRRCVQHGTRLSCDRGPALLSNLATHADDEGRSMPTPRRDSAGRQEQRACFAVARERLRQDLTGAVDRLRIQQP